MNNEFRSNFILDIKGNMYDEFVESVVKPVLKNFLFFRFNENMDYEIIQPENHISFQDFINYKKSDFAYFYAFFLNDIKKENEKYVLKKKVCISFDERLCNQYCQQTHRKFATINLGGEDLVFFILFDIKEVFDFLYKDTNDVIDKATLNQSHEISREKYQTDRVGYIHNHNNHFSYIRTSAYSDGFPLYHSIFPQVKELDVGTIIKANCEVDNKGQVIRVDSYHIGSEEDLSIYFEIFEGNLRRSSGKRIAFIRNGGNSILVPSHLAQEFEEEKNYAVECLAVESYDKTKQQMGWEAIKVEGIESSVSE